MAGAVGSVAQKPKPMSCWRETLEAATCAIGLSASFTAEVVHPSVDGSVAFGSTVTIECKGRKQTFRIVGVDEADAAKGLISFRSPMAQAGSGRSDRRCDGGKRAAGAKSKSCRSGLGVRQPLRRILVADVGLEIAALGPRPSIIPVHSRLGTA